MLRIYLASPLGFSPETESYRSRIIAKLTALGFNVFDPWTQTQFAPLINDALSIDGFSARTTAFREIATKIGGCNTEGIIESDCILAVLDGAEVDSGTAAEIGFASALDKPCFGLRTDVRDCGDFTGIPINLQVLHFIERSGGKLFRSIEEITFELAPVRG